MGVETLPTLVVIGAMKAGTSALHAYLGAHPQVAMSRTKELNFFNGPDRAPSGDPSHWWVNGQWHRGLAWYATQFDPTATARGEASPAYTSPTFPEVAARMAEVLPDVRLLYAVREPFARALSQYAHHRRDGAERRTPEEALLDEGSHYLARSRYVERLRPFLDLFARDQLHVVVAERLLRHRDDEMRRVFTHVGVDPVAVDSSSMRRLVHRGDAAPATAPDLRTQFRRRVADDVEELRDLLGDPLEEWRG